MTNKQKTNQIQKTIKNINKWATSKYNAKIDTDNNSITLICEQNKLTCAVIEAIKEQGYKLVCAYIDYDNELKALFIPKEVGEKTPTTPKEND